MRRCHWRHELSVGMAVAAVVHHSRDRTRTVADASVQVSTRETEFFEMNRSMSGDFSLDVSMNASECKRCTECRRASECGAFFWMQRSKSTLDLGLGFWKELAR